MMDDIRAHVSDVTDEDEMRAYIGKIVDKEAFDHKGLVYGMGHAVYSLSDRARWCSRALCSSWPWPRAARRT